MGSNLTIPQDVRMMSDNPNVDEVYEHEDLWEMELKHLMAEAARYQEDVLQPETHSEYTYEELQSLSEKKDKALMLAGKIGHSLLAKINDLVCQNKDLEQVLDQKDELIQQLEYEKNQLVIQMKLQSDDDDDDVDDDNGADATDGGGVKDRTCSVSSAGSCTETLRIRLDELDTVNCHLRSQVEQLMLDKETSHLDAANCRRQNEILEQEIHDLREKLNKKRQTVELNTEKLKRTNVEVVLLAGQLLQMEAEIEKLQSRLETSLLCSRLLQNKYDEVVKECEEYKSLYDTIRAETRARRRVRRVTISGQTSIAQELNERLEPVRLPCYEQIHSRLLRAMKLASNCTSGQCPVSIHCQVVNHCHCTHQSSDAASKETDLSWKNKRRVLGEPGRPGSCDLNYSLLRLEWLADKRRRFPCLPAPEARTDDESLSCVSRPINRTRFVKVFEERKQQEKLSHEIVCQGDISCWDRCFYASRHHTWASYPVASGLEVAMTFWALHRVVRKFCN